nr:hypothetical protein GCM10025730_06000 [Promicromonospora thailandica]
MHGTATQPGRPRTHLPPRQARFGGAAGSRTGQPRAAPAHGRLPHAAAYVVDPGFQILAANTTAKALLGPVQLALGAFDFLFVDPAARSYFEHWDQVARSAVSALRLAAGFASPHPAVPPLVSRLLAGSSEFAAFWADQTVAGLSLTEKVINHPDVGRITLTYQTLDVREAPGQQLTVATAPAGSASADALALLGTLEATRTMRP